MATAPEFIERDLQVIVDEMVADYETRTGRILQPAQVERLLINAFAYREALVREKIQYAATQNLVDFASAPVLDYLGALVGVTRLAASSATVTVEFTLVAGHGGVTIPQGTRVSTTDGLAVFRTQVDVIVAPGVTTASTQAENVTEGTAGNGYGVGTITLILDPQAFLSAVTNTDISGGGAEQEQDEPLRERIKLAPGSFSNAGSRGAYEFFSLSASPSISDVAILGPPDIAPGQVEIYPLMADGSVTPLTVLDAVDAAVNSEKVRPLTDTVTVIPPTRVDYDISVNVTVYTDADSVSVQTSIEERLAAFALAKRQQLGQDIMIAQIVAQCMVEGVYTVNVTALSISGNLIIAPTEFGYCNSITVNIIGSTNG
jgi:phage-related baseplate assembly protein